MCCHEEPCAIAVEMLDAGPLRRCPALEWEGGRFWCGLVRHPSRYLPAAQEIEEHKRPWLDEMVGPMIAAQLGGVGGGCDSDTAPTTVGAASRG